MPSVLYVSTFYENLGGVEKAITDVANGLSADYDVEVLCTKHGLKTVTEQCGRIRVTRCGSLFSVAGRPLSLSFIMELGKRHVDIVHYHLPFPLGTIAHLLWPPKAKAVVATWHHDLVKYPVFNFFYTPALKLFMEKTTAFHTTFPGQTNSRDFLQKLANKSKTIPLGIAHERYVQPVNQAEIEQLRARFGAPLVLFVGRLVYYKGIEVLVQAIKQTTAQLVIVGEGPLRQSIESQIESLGLSSKVHLAGRLSDDDLLNLYQACDIFVLPSTLTTECFGLVQVEAMLCGKPVINTALPTGVPWVSVHEETGLTVSPNDANALAKAINTLVADETLRQKFGQNARKRALENFTLEKHVKAVEAAYAEILKIKTEPSPIG